MSKVYLVTGCSAGLGYELSKAILLAGHKLIATSRDPSKTPDIVAEIQRLGGYWGTLDVTSSDLDSQFHELYKVYGQIDVLINNAGIAIGATVEQTEMEVARLVFETNFFGVMRLTQLAIPLMRSQGGGTIVNISSGATVNPLPMIAVYGASKNAIEGFTEALKKEVAGFKIRVLLAHPGDMRTSFISRSNATEIKDEYKGTAADFVAKLLRSTIGAIDPAKAATTIVEAVDETGELQKLIGEDYVRIPLGARVANGIKQRSKELVHAVEVFDGISQSVDIQE